MISKEMAKIKIAKNLKRLYKNSGYTRWEDLASDAGVSRSMLIAMRERRNIANIAIVANVAKCFGVPIEEMLQ